MELTTLCLNPFILTQVERNTLTIGKQMPIDLGLSAAMGS